MGPRVIALAEAGMGGLDACDGGVVRFEAATAPVAAVRWFVAVAIAVAIAVTSAAVQVVITTAAEDHVVAIASDESVVTITAVVAIREFVFKNESIGGPGAKSNNPVPRPSFFGWDVGIQDTDRGNIPDRWQFAVFALFWVVVLSLAVTNLRRGGTGRRFLAIRANERAAAAAGVDVAMLDIIGAEETIREVYHLDRPVADFEETVAAINENRPSSIDGHEGRLGPRAAVVDRLGHDVLARPAVTFEQNGGGLKLHVEDVENVKIIEVEPDLVVLATGMVPNAADDDLALFTRKDEEGFVLVASLLIMVVLTILGIATTTNTTIELQIEIPLREIVTRGEEKFHATV